MPRRFSPLDLAMAAGAAALAGYAAFGAGSYELRVLTVAGVYALAALGYQLIFGRAGALSLAQGAFYGIGAYVTGILGARYGLPFAATFPLSMLVPLALALAVGVPVLRLESHYFALATLGIAQVVLLLAVNAQDLTGGANGIPGVPGVELFGWTVPRGRPLAAFVWAWVAVGAWIAWRIGRGLYGRGLDLLREDPVAAASLGVDIGRRRLEVFALSAAFGGAAGALAVHTQRVVSPEVLEFPIMVTVLTIAVVGGRGRVAGALLGALLLIHLPEWFRFLERGYLIVYGAVLLAFIVAAPWGLVGTLERYWPRPARSLPEPRAPEPRPAPAGPVLHLDALAKSFGGVRAVDGVSLALERGRITGLIGPNGSGKTTLINLITGLERADSGRIVLFGRDVAGATADRIARAGVARTFQAANLPVDASALDAVVTARITLDRSLPLAEAHALHLLERTGAAGAARQPCGSLAPGLRRRVELARALARQPALLLLDEPAAGLNEGEQADLARRLRQLADDGLTILLVEHNMPFLMPLADCIVCLDEGRVIAEGEPAEVRTNPKVVEAYLGESKGLRPLTPPRAEGPWNPVRGTV